MEKEKKVKNNIAEREDAKEIVVDIKIDEKQPVKKRPGVPTNKEERQAIFDSYKLNCERFPARMGKFKGKEKSLLRWVKTGISIPSETLEKMEAQAKAEAEKKDKEKVN